MGPPKVVVFGLLTVNVPAIVVLFKVPVTERSPPILVGPGIDNALVLALYVNPGSITAGLNPIPANRPIEKVPVFPEVFTRTVLEFSIVPVIALALIAPYMVPPTHKSFTIPTPPATTREPVVVDED